MLKISKLTYRVETEKDNVYGSETIFSDGLNIIFGPNSLGKTSIITGIVYGLGAEKSLGIFKSSQNPFKPEFYKRINDEKITRSYLLLEITNGKETVTIFRYISGGNINVSEIKYCETDSYFKETDGKRLIVVGEGVFSENGFQKFIYEFLNLPLVELPTYNHTTSKLYFENLVSLFFVEQRAGWSQIQSRQVTRYAIRDVRRVVFEYLLGLDRFQIHLVQLELKEVKDKLKKQKEKLQKKEENLLIISNAEKIDDTPIIKTREIGNTSIHEYIRYLKKKYEAQSKSLNDLTSLNERYESENLRLRDNIKRNDYLYRSLCERINKIDDEINSYKNYLERIRDNKYKNRQLEKIQEFSNEVNIDKCPVCQSKIDKQPDTTCFLCHSEIENPISSPQENLVFLEDEEKTFKKVISKRFLDRKKLIEERSRIKEKIIKQENHLANQTTTYAGKEFAALREKILEIDELFNFFKRLERVVERWDELNPLRVEIKKSEEKKDRLKERIDSYLQSKSDYKVLNTVKHFLKENVKELGLFKNNEKLIDLIKLDSSSDYEPYLDNYDIYNISSSSDNIRIILSYYLSILQSSVELKKMDKIRYPNLLIFDEPKQQNLDNESLIDCIGLITDLPKFDTQVILTTYTEKVEDKEAIEEFIVYEMENKTDYLLKKIQ